MTEELKKVCAQPEPEVEPKANPLPELSMVDIIEATDLPILPVDVPEWGGMVYIKTLTGTERDKFADRVMKQTPKEGPAKISGLTIQLLSSALCDKDGNRLCKTAQDDVKLDKKSATTLERLFLIAQKHNRLEEEVEKLAENS